MTLKNKEKGMNTLNDSPLVVHTRISPNKTVNRNHAIDRISPHCVVGQVTAESLGSWFAQETTAASSNYGIDRDGRVGMYVRESDTSWCTSSGENDGRAVTIECASDIKAPYAFNDAVYEKLIELCADICKRNGKTKLIWFGDRNKTLKYQPKPNEMVLTVHRWFANKSCPGDWMYSRMGDLANKVNAKLGATIESKNEETETEDNVTYYVQIGAYGKKENALAMASKLKDAGFNAIVKAESKNNTNKNETDKPADNESFSIGDKVKLQEGAPRYGTSEGFKPWVYDYALYVREVNGSRIVISTLKQGAITGAVDKKYLTKI